MAVLTITQQLELLNDPKNKIPWDRLEKWGLTKDVILEADQMRQAHGGDVLRFVNHGFSPVFKVSPDYKSNDVTITGELFGAVRFYEYKGEPKIEFQIARPEYKMEEDIYINDRTVLRANSDDPAEKQAHDNLIKYGFAGMLVDVYDYRWKNLPDGPRQKCFVAIDMSDDRHRGTNQAVYVRQSFVKERLEKNDNKIGGAVLTPEEKSAYLSAEEVLIRGMKTKSGRSFDSYVRFNPVTGLNSYTEGLAKQQAESAKQQIAISEEEKQEVAETRSRGRKR